jgi:hypothetical protein
MFGVGKPVVAMARSYALPATPSKRPGNTFQDFMTAANELRS